MAGKNTKYHALSTGRKEYYVMNKIQQWWSGTWILKVNLIRKTLEWSFKDKRWSSLDLSID